MSAGLRLLPMLVTGEVRDAHVPAWVAIETAGLARLPAGRGRGGVPGVVHRGDAGPRSRRVRSGAVLLAGRVVKRIVLAGGARRVGGARLAGHAEATVGHGGGA